MSKKEIPDFTQNRELSWLRFNQRVLEEARDESVPLMERMKFVAIFTSNLDEFFMIRVGSLYDLAATDDKKIDQRSGMTAKQQLDAIYRAVSPLYKERDKTYAEIKKQLHPYGVCGLDFKELEQQEKKFVKKYFKEEVLPVLSPQIVDANHPFPHLLSKEIYVVANLKQGDKAMLGIIPVPQYISNILYLPGYDIRYIRMEKIILEFAELVFNQYQVSDKNYICVTRNADVSPDDEAYADHGDFRHIMKETLHKRKKMAVVPNGKPSRTAWRVLEHLSGAAYLDVHLLTGRTHQIRVHMLSIGHPLLGDQIYAPKLKTPVRIPRLMLHAYSLAFTHPTTGERMRFCAPLPAAFEETLQKLR